MCKGSCRRRACETVTEGLLPYFINYGGSAAYNPPFDPPFTQGGLGRGVFVALYTRGLVVNSPLLYTSEQNDANDS